MEDLLCINQGSFEFQINVARECRVGTELPTGTSVNRAYHLGNKVDRSSLSIGQAAVYTT